MLIKRKLFQSVVTLSSVILLSGLVQAKPNENASKVVDIQHWETAKGAKVFFVELHQLPIVDTQVVFAAGSSYDKGKPGIASMVNSLLDGGAGDKNADQIAEAFDGVGSNYSSYAGRDASVVSFRSLSDKKYLDPTLSVFADILGKANFPQSAFSRVQKQTLTHLKYYQQLPSKIASKAFYHAVYGDQPYAHQTIGSVDSIKKMQRADLNGFYKQYYVAHNANVIIVGDVSRAQAEAMAEKITNKMPEGTSAAPIAQVKPIVNHQVHNISFPSTQTYVLIGQLGIASKSPDYFPSIVGNHILGGGVLTSRLIKVIREDHGYAYHAASSFVTMKREGPFLIQLQTRNAEVKNATDLALRTLNDFVEKGPDANELNSAKRNLIQSFPFKVSSNSSILANVANIASNQLPLDYLDTYCQKVKAVEAKDVKHVFQRIIQKDHLVTITVGNATS